MHLANLHRNSSKRDAGRQESEQTFVRFQRAHRNSQKRFYDQDYIYFITTITQQRFPFFREDIFCRLFLDNLRISKKIKEFKLYAFTIIPDHIHLLIKPEGKNNISEIMHTIKRHFSRNINLIIDDANIVFNEGEVCKPRLHLDAHDFNKEIIRYRKLFVEKYGDPQYEIPAFKWQQSFHDHVIRHEKDFYKHLNYIANNCIKHNIGEDKNKYRWSFLSEEWREILDDYE